MMRRTKPRQAITADNQDTNDAEASKDEQTAT